MKKINIPYVALILLLVVSMVSFKAAHDTTGFLSEKDKLKQSLVQAEQSTIDILQAMPGEDYAFRPNQEVLPFKDQIHHMVHEVEFLALELKPEDSDWSPDHEYVEDKAGLIALTKTSFERLCASVEQQRFTIGLEDKVADFLTDNANLRGQLKVYLNMKGVRN